MGLKKPDLVKNLCWKRTFCELQAETDGCIQGIFLLLYSVYAKPKMKPLPIIKLLFYYQFIIQFNVHNSPMTWVLYWPCFQLSTRRFGDKGYLVSRLQSQDRDMCNAASFTEWISDLLKRALRNVIRVIFIHQSLNEFLLWTRHWIVSKDKFIWTCRLNIPYFCFHYTNMPWHFSSCYSPVIWYF